MFGENPQLEYGGPEKSRDNMVMDRAWRQEFGLMRNFREEDMLDDELPPSRWAVSVDVCMIISMLFM